MAVMELGFTAGIAAIVLLGVLGQLLGHAVKVPSIIVLLPSGCWPDRSSGWVDPDALLGDALFPLVSMAVGLLLFEESLKLDFSPAARRSPAPGAGPGHDRRGRHRHLRHLLAQLVFDLPFSRAAVIGAILIVSGPDRRRAAARSDPAEAAARVGAGVRGHLHRPDRRHRRAEHGPPRAAQERDGLGITALVGILTGLAPPRRTW